MKKNLVLLLSSLFILPGCMDTGKETKSEKKSGAILLSIDGKPVIYESDYETFYNDFLNMRQDLQSYLAINPAVKDEIRKGIFEELVYQNIFTEWVKRNKKDQDADYKKNRDKAYEMIDRKLAIEAFQQDVMKNAANLVSDEEAEKYYNENKDKSGYFKQQPFVVSAGGVESEGVSFDSEKSAKDFMAKAKAAAANFANLARDIKKSVADFGAVSAQSQDVDSNVKKDILSARDITGVILSKGADKKFWVIRIKGKRDTEFAPFAQVKEAVKEVVQQSKLPEIFKAKIDEVKNNLKVVENKEFFAAKPVPAPAEQGQEAMPEAATQAQPQAQSNGGSL